MFKPISLVDDIDDFIVLAKHYSYPSVAELLKDIKKAGKLSDFAELVRTLILSRPSIGEFFRILNQNAKTIRDKLLVNCHKRRPLCKCTSLC